MRTTMMAALLLAGGCALDTVPCVGGGVRGDAGVCECPDGSAPRGQQCVPSSDGSVTSDDAADAGDAVTADAGVASSGGESTEGDDAATVMDDDAAVPVDVCSDLGTFCKPAYPCRATPESGFTCLGQYADWPMPDNAGTTPAVYTATALTVVDVVTGLVWQRVTPTAYEGCAKGAECTWDEAVAYCSGLTVGDLDDWRVPSMVELASLLDLSASPTIDSVFTAPPARVFWTSSPYAASPTNTVWSIDFGAGFVGQREVSLSFDSTPVTAQTRCVRGGYSGALRPMDRFATTVTSRGTEVSDRFTGLTWLVEESWTYRTWAASSTYCTSLGAGYRMPTIKELLTIVDPTRSSPAVDPQVFRLSKDWFWYWSASSLPGTSGMVWQFGVLYGQPAPETPAPGTTAYVLCVKEA
jgi:Protein of unknown function (DUF1566)